MALHLTALFPSLLVPTAGRGQDKYVYPARANGAGELLVQVPAPQVRVPVYPPEPPHNRRQLTRHPGIHLRVHRRARALVWSSRAR